MNRPSDTEAHLDEAGIAEIARALYRGFHGRDLRDVEADIESARRIAWVSSFTGASLDGIVALYGRSEQAVALALRLGSYSLLTVEAILQELRFGLYVNSFGADPNTRFGSRMAQAALEAAARGQPRH